MNINVKFKCIFLIFLGGVLALHAILRPFSSVLRKERLTGIQTLDFYEPDVLPATQTMMSKHYRKKLE